MPYVILILKLFYSACSQAGISTYICMLNIILNLLLWCVCLCIYIFGKENEILKERGWRPLHFGPNTKACPP